MSGEKGNTLASYIGFILFMMGLAGFGGLGYYGYQVVFNARVFELSTVLFIIVVSLVSGYVGYRIMQEN